MISTFKIVINDGKGATAKEMEESHTFTRTVEAEDLANALIEVWEDIFGMSFEETVKDEYGKDLEDLSEEELDDINDFYEDPLIRVEDLDCNSGEPFVEKIYEDGELIFFHMFFRNIY